MRYEILPEVPAGSAAGGSGPSVGEVVDNRYELRRIVARSESESVFEAQHRFTHRAVQLRLVHLGAPGQSGLFEELLRDVRALTALRHPGIFELLDGGQLDASTAYVAYEAISGRTLEGLLTARGALSAEDSMGIALQLASSLGATHRAGVVHGALSSTNVFVLESNGSEKVKIANFGLGLTASTPKLAAEDGAASSDRLRQNRAPASSPSATSPDVRSDVFAVGSIAFHCLNGSPLATRSEGAKSTDDGDPARTVAKLLGDRVDEKIRAVVERAMSSNPDHRFSSMGELSSAICSAVPGAIPRTMLLRQRPDGAPPPSRRLDAPKSAPQPVDDDSQRRRTKRAGFSTPVRIVLSNGQSVDGRSEDISVGGMLVLSRVACDPGQEVVVRFALPVEGYVVECKANVRWVRASRANQTGSLRAIGVEFFEVSPKVAASLGHYVELMSG